MSKILIIDDDKELCALIKKYAEQNNHIVQVAHSGSEGLQMAETEPYHLIVLDVMLPVINGFSVLTELRKKNATPVLMLTAKDAETDKITGLKLGADDYLTKPFSVNELMARMESLIRRYTKLNPSNFGTLPLLERKGLTVNPETRKVFANGSEVDLSAKEFDLLYFLAAHAGRIYTKKQLYSEVWEDEYAFDDSNIMSFISKLRKKIEPDPNNPFYIQTVRGVGYRFNQEAAR